MAIAPGGGVRAHLAGAGRRGAAAVHRLGPAALAPRAGLVGLCLLVAAGVGFLLFIGGNAALREIQLLAANTAARDAWQMPRWLQGSAFQAAVAGRLPSPSQVLQSITGDQGQLILPALLGFSSSLLEVVAGRSAGAVLERLLERAPNAF